MPIARIVLRDLQPDGLHQAWKEVNGNGQDTRNDGAGGSR